LHETVILLTVITTDNARVSPSEHIQTESLGHGFYRVIVRYGFFENVNVPVALGAALRQLKLPLSDRLYLLGRETLVASDAGKMSARMERFFAFLSRNSRPMTDHFRLPPDQCLEIGSRVDL
jgi:KUP system potassium uptake protein